MAVALSNLMSRAWREIGHSKTIVATGGSTTTVVDTNSIYTTDNSLVGGTVVVVWDAGGAGAAPEGEYSRITAYVASTETFTMDAVTSAVGAGDWIDLVKPTIPLQQMVQFVNDGLTGLGYIQGIDTSITTADSQTEYTLPVTAKTGDLVDILLQGQTGDANDNQWVSIKSKCHWEPAAGGTTGLLYTPQYASGYTIRFIYNGYHPTLTAYNSVLWEYIPKELAVAAAIDKALTWLVSKKGNSALGGLLPQRWNDAKVMLANAKIEHPVYKFQKKPKWFTLSTGGDYEAPVGKVRL